MKILYPQTIRAFTLIELLVSITIFSIILISVMSLFLFSSQMAQSSEFQRVLQENSKSVLEDMAEQIRKTSIEWIAEIGDIDSDCTQSWSSVVGVSICFEDGVKYTIGNNQWGLWLPISDITQCRDAAEDDESICRILKKVNGNYIPLTNNRAAITGMDIQILNPSLSKVSLTLQMRPAFGKGIQNTIVENNTLFLQTTLSKRIIETY